MPCRQANTKLGFPGTQKVGQGRLAKGVLFFLGGCLLCTLTAYVTHEDTAGHSQGRVQGKPTNAELPVTSAQRTRKQSQGRAMTGDRTPERWPEALDCDLHQSQEDDVADEEEEEEEEGSVDTHTIHTDGIATSGEVHTIPNDSNINILKMRPPAFLPNYKNPCWIEELTTNSPYANNIYAGRSRRMQSKFHALDKLWKKRYARGRRTRLRCLPYYYIAGMPKCGTTDLYFKLILHPDVTPALVKEPHWWTRRRVHGGPHDVTGDASFQNYVDLFDKAAECIHGRVTRRHLASNRDNRYHGMIVGEGSASTLWDNRGWRHVPENDASAPEPRFLIPDLIRHVTPGAKVLVILRDPIDRLWSDYLYFRQYNKSAENFDMRVRQSIDLMTDCIHQRSLRGCLSNDSLISNMGTRLYIGMYHSYLKEWLKIFPRDQIHVLRLEDYSKGPIMHLNKIAKFLGLDPFPEAIGKKIIKLPKVNTRRRQDRHQGAMWSSTRSALQDFYSPYNEQLANLLGSAKYLWNDT